MTDDSDLRDERERLIELVASLQSTFDGIVHAAADVATDDEHDPEGHTIAFERQQTAALLRGARSRLAEIDHAISRLDAGEYGTCEKCGTSIPTERLQALPATRHCVNCAAS